MGAIFDRESYKLYLYSYRTTEVWAPWPAPMAWSKSDDEADWRHLRPALKLPGRPVRGELARFHARERKIPYNPYPTRAEEKAAIRRGEKLARLEWAALIPDPVRSAVAPFGTRQWHLLSMAARCGDAALELIEANPALAFMLASNWVFHKPAVQQPLRSVRALLKPGRKQVAILDWLGFPARRAVRRLLARIPPASVSIQRLLYLRGACRDDEALKQMFHLPRLNSGCLRIVTDPALSRHVTQLLLAEIAADRSEDRAGKCRAARLLADTLRMREEIGRPVTGRLPARTVEQLEHCHDEAVELLNRINAGAATDSDATRPVRVRFPPPPLPGNSAVVPITTHSELRAEGVRMHHCVASYAREVSARSGFYIYRVVEPERATLAIRHTVRGWTISEISGERNKPVSSETRSRVQAWIDAVSGDRTGIR